MNFIKPASRLCWNCTSLTTQVDSHGTPQCETCRVKLSNVLFLYTLNEPIRKVKGIGRGRPKKKVQ